MTEEMVANFESSTVKSIAFYKSNESNVSLISNTIQKDSVRSEEDALAEMYQQLRSIEAPDSATARSLVEKLFFNPKRYDLGDVGRFRLNLRLGLDIPRSTTTLTKEDIITIMKYLIELHQGKRSVDDIDHLGNRRVRTVGEQIAQQVNLGIARMARTIREKMNLREKESLTPQALVNARAITSVIN